MTEHTIRVTRLCPMETSAAMGLDSVKSLLLWCDVTHLLSGLQIRWEIIIYILPDTRPHGLLHLRQIATPEAG